MKLIRNNSSFVCVVCNNHVEKAVGNSRDHCPFCIVSVHLDHEVPGDRLSSCRGVMDPIGIRKWKQDSYKVLFLCKICKKEQWNITAVDDSSDVLAQIIMRSNREQMNAN